VALGFDAERERVRNERAQLYPFVILRGVGIHITRKTVWGLQSPYGWPVWRYAWRFQHAGRVYESTISFSYTSHASALDAALATLVRATGGRTPARPSR
jgi:hypothetical protein